MRKTVFLVAAGALLAQGPAALAAPKRSTPAGGAKDPNEIVCEKQTVIGSRLATKRVCLTRAQWADQREVAKNTVNGLQRGGSACTLGKNC